MNQSAEASVRSTDSASFQLADYCLWEEPERGKRIYLKLAAVDHLQLEALRGIDGFPSDEVEVGGILIGRTEIDRERAITLIDDFAPVPCSYHNGPLYRLSEKEAVKFETVMKRCSSDPRGLSVVGYYRSHNRDNLYLSSDDLNLIQKYFSEPEKVFLLIKTLPSRACTAGFFFWEDGHIQTEFTYLEVPLGPVQSFPVGEPALPATVRVDDRLTPAAKHLPKMVPTIESLHLSGSVRRSRRVWLVRGFAVTVAAVVVTLAGLNYWQSRSLRPQETATTSLGLQVQRQPGSLTLTWNPNSRDLLGAEEAILYINEGSNQRAIHLDPSQLRSAEVSFVPSSDDVELRFEIDRGGKPTAVDKVHLLLPNVPVEVAVREAAPNSTNPRGTDLKKMVVARSNSSQRDGSPALSASVVKKEQGQPTAPLTSSVSSSPKPLQFVAPARSDLSSNGSVPATNDIPFDQPPSIPVETETMKLIVTLPVITLAAPPPAENSSQPAVERRPIAQNEAQEPSIIPTASGRGPQQLPPVSSFVGPQLIRRVDPAIPTDLRSKITSDTRVDVAITIDVSGRVTDARVTSTSGAVGRLITFEVLQAARLFQFRPAHDKNRSVESQVDLTFRFSVGPTK
jgi:proteasome lid subunit RPN8/RPN11